MLRVQASCSGIPLLHCLHVLEKVLRVLCAPLGPHCQPLPRIGSLDLVWRSLISSTQKTLKKKFELQRPLPLNQDILADRTFKKKYCCAHNF